MSEPEGAEVGVVQSLARSDAAAMVELQQLVEEMERVIRAERPRAVRHEVLPRPLGMPGGDPPMEPHADCSVGGVGVILLQQPNICGSFPPLSLTGLMRNWQGGGVNNKAGFDAKPGKMCHQKECEVSSAHY